tara:strand:+ start:490 stop:774 length:285 start_codon:yes stop_codon:yes gene_type:complete
MAVGDVVNGVSALGAAINFQPSAGSECMISSTSGWGDYNGLYNTSMTFSAVMTLATNNIAGTSGNVKIFINNTNYLNCRVSVSYYTGYTGIQIK